MGGAVGGVTSSASAIAQAALTSPMWLNACGKLPSSSPVPASTSSDRSPTSFTYGRGGLERRARPVEVAGERLRVGQPERAQEERALLAVEAVGAAVPVDEPALVGEVGSRWRRSSPASAGGRRG